MKLHASNSAGPPVDFNQQWAKTVKETEFIRHFLPLIWQDLPEPKRKAELSKAHKILNGKPVEDDKPVDESGKPTDKNQGDA
ncbi:MAG: hypothetical protein LBD91_02075 [Prevotellaceae bacterium]|jgi:hypothetical protein|nr:hypothetical protein [Prevotellaceae bacterium]